MRYVVFSFTDENFGDKIECALIWDDTSFILISVCEDKINIKKYTDITDLFKELVVNRNELEILREIVDDQEKEIEEMEKEIKWLKRKEKH